MDSALLSLVGFSIAMYITPGPNNVMVAASAANHGIGATTPHMFGIAIGFSLMLTLVCAGLGSALLNWPLLLPLFRWVGSIWLALLAWQIATAPPPGEGGRDRVLGFFGAAAFQWINPKAWVMAVTAMATYTNPDLYVVSVLIVGLAFALVNVPSVSTWAGFGSALRDWLSDPARLKWFNITMALLLVLSLWPMLK